MTELPEMMIMGFASVLVSLVAAAVMWLKDRLALHDETVHERWLRTDQAFKDAVRAIEELSVERERDTALLRRQFDFVADRVVLLEKAAPVVVRVDATRGEGSARCPYCHDAITSDACVVRCVRCDARHHVECYGEHRRCAVFACGSREAVQAQEGNRA